MQGLLTSKQGAFIQPMKSTKKLGLVNHVSKKAA